MSRSRRRIGGGALFIETANGIKFDLTELGADVAGMGKIPVEYQSQRGMNQHGVTLKEWHLGPRTLSLSFPLDAISHQALWALRTDLIEIVSMIGNSAMMLQYVYPDGSQRSIDCWLQNNDLEWTEGLDSVNSSLEFLCPDPSWYDPSQQSSVLSSTDSSALVFPFSFPSEFFFGDAYQLIASINNAGNWYSWPELIIDGPFTRIVITNTTTDQSFTLAGAGLALGDTITVTLTPGEQDIVDDDGESQFDWLESGNIVKWWLQPGNNELSITGSGISSDTEITIRHYNRYIAI